LCGVVCCRDRCVVSSWRLDRPASTTDAWTADVCDSRQTVHDVTDSSTSCCVPSS